MTANLFAQNGGRLPHLTLVDSGLIVSKPPFKACHASTIEYLPDGKLIAAWFAGEREGDSMVGIWTSIKDKQGWSFPVEVADGKQAGGKTFACWNPVLFRPANDTLYLHYKVGPSPREWWAVYKTSSDGGKSWSEAIALPDGFLGPIKNKPIQLGDGDILYPSSVETPEDNHWTIHLERSDAHLQHWQMIPVNCDTFQTIQPTLLRHGGDTLQLLARSKENVITQSWSHDEGRTWEPVTATNIINPNSGVDAVTLKNGAHLLVYNPTLSGKDWWNGRSELRLAASTDGKQWTDIFTFENRNEGEFSYPAIIATDTGDVFVTYTYDRVNVKFFHFSVENL